MFPSDDLQPITIVLPLLYKDMVKGKIKLWYVEEEPPTLVQPGQQLLSIETEVRVYSIPVPPTITVPYRVKQLFKRAGDEVAVGEDLVLLEPA